MQLYCPSCQATYAAAPRCPRCGDRLVTPAESFSALSHKSPPPPDIVRTTPAGRITIGCALAPSPAEAQANLHTALATEPHAPAGGGAARPAGAVLRSEQAWHAYFDALPRFRCSDPYLEKYYYYRYFGVRLNAFEARAGA